MCSKKIYKKTQYLLYYIIVIIDIDFATYFLTYNPTTKEFDNISEDEILYDQLYVMGAQDFLFIHSAPQYPHISTKEYVKTFNNFGKYLKKINENCILRFKEFIK